MKTDSRTPEAVAARMRHTEPVIDDIDFTTAVLAQLPRANALSDGFRNAIVLGATVLGSALAAWYSVLPAIPGLLEALTVVATNPAPALLAAGALTWGAAFAALWSVARS